MSGLGKSKEINALLAARQSMENRGLAEVLEDRGIPLNNELEELFNDLQIELDAADVMHEQPSSSDDDNELDDNDSSYDPSPMSATPSNSTLTKPAPQKSIAGSMFTLPTQSTFRPIKPTAESSILRELGNGAFTPLKCKIHQEPGIVTIHPGYKQFSVHAQRGKEEAKLKESAKENNPSSANVSVKNLKQTMTVKKSG